MSNDLHYDDISHTIIRAARSVHHRLGPGLVERCYQEDLAQEMAVLGLAVEREKAVRVTVDEEIRGVLHLDHLVNGSVIVECKAISRALRDEEMLQVKAYLAVSGLPLGLLLNFGRKRLEWQRVFPPQRLEDWRRRVAPYLRRRQR